jgi:hypothetical protein
MDPGEALRANKCALDHLASAKQGTAVQDGRSSRGRTPESELRRGQPRGRTPESEPRRRQSRGRTPNTEPSRGQTRGRTPDAEPASRGRLESDNGMPNATTGRSHQGVCAAAVALASECCDAHASLASSAAEASDASAAGAGEGAGQGGHALDKDERDRLHDEQARAQAEPLVVQTSARSRDRAVTPELRQATPELRPVTPVRPVTPEMRHELPRDDVINSLALQHEPPASDAVFDAVDDAAVDDVDDAPHTAASAYSSLSPTPSLDDSSMLPPAPWLQTAQVPPAAVADARDTRAESAEDGIGADGMAGSAAELQGCRHEPGTAGADSRVQEGRGGEGALEKGAAALGLADTVLDRAADMLGEASQASTRRNGRTGSGLVFARKRNKCRRLVVEPAAAADAPLSVAPGEGGPEMLEDCGSDVALATAQDARGNAGCVKAPEQGEDELAEMRGAEALSLHRSAASDDERAHVCAFVDAPCSPRTGFFNYLEMHTCIAMEGVERNLDGTGDATRTMEQQPFAISLSAHLCLLKQVEEGGVGGGAVRKDDGEVVQQEREAQEEAGSSQVTRVRQEVTSATQPEAAGDAEEVGASAVLGDSQSADTDAEDKTDMHIAEMQDETLRAAEVEVGMDGAGGNEISEEEEQHENEEQHSDEEEHCADASPRASVPARCVTRGTAQNQKQMRLCSMESLLEAGLVQAGLKVLSVTRNGRTLFGDLLSDSTIRYSCDNRPQCKCLRFKSPSGFGNYCCRSLDSKFKRGNGFTYVCYSADGKSWKPLDNYRQQFSLLQLHAEEANCQASQRAASSCQRLPVNPVKASSLVRAASSARAASQLPVSQGARKKGRPAHLGRASKWVRERIPGMRVLMYARDGRDHGKAVEACVEGGDGSSHLSRPSSPAPPQDDAASDASGEIGAHARTDAPASEYLQQEPCQSLFSGQHANPADQGSAVGREMQRGEDEEDVACVRSRSEHGGEGVVADLSSALSRQGDAPAMQTADGDAYHVHAQDHAGNMHLVACAAERSKDMGQEDMGQEGLEALALFSAAGGRSGNKRAPRSNGALAATHSSVLEQSPATTRRLDMKAQTRLANAFHGAYLASELVEARFASRKDTWYPADVVEKARAGVSYPGMARCRMGLNNGSLYLVRYHNKAFGQRLVNIADMRPCHDFDWLKPLTMQRGCQPLQLVHAFAEGDRVEARFRHEEGNKLWYPGRIAQVRTDGTYKVDYDDGDSEAAVRCQNIRHLCPRAGAGGSAAGRGASVACIAPSLKRPRYPLVGVWGWRQKKIARVAAVAEKAGTQVRSQRAGHSATVIEGRKTRSCEAVADVPHGDVATLQMGAEGVCDNIAALQRRGDTSRVHVSARICYKWNVNQWYMGTVQKRCDVFG